MLFPRHEELSHGKTNGLENLTTKRRPGDEKIVVTQLSTSVA